MANLILSWLSAILVILCIAIWPLRIICKNDNSSNNRYSKGLLSILRKLHAPLGLFSIVTVFIHCRVAFMATGDRSLIGSLLFLCLLGLASSGFLKKLLPKYWLWIHKTLTVFVLLLLLFHAFIEFQI